ncbi:MAG: hypothetical protein ACJ780_27720 [Solirubrobacteraceae bacterium]
MDHLEPFQRSASVDPLLISGAPATPTAMQNRLDLHDTPARLFWIGAPRPGFGSGLGICWIDHRLPFQRSANAEVSLVVTKRNPTAMQNLLDVHDTLASAAVKPVEGVG